MTQKEPELLTVVDNGNEVIGKATKKEIFGKKLIHRASLALVFNSKDELLIHQRALTKDRNPGKWDCFVGGGVQWKETYEQAVEREIKEEIGRLDEKPELLFKAVLEVDITVMMALFKTKIKGPITSDKREIAQVEFVNRQDVPRLMRERTFTAKNYLFIPRYLEMIKKKNNCNPTDPHEKEWVGQVDQNDKLIGKITRAKALRENVLHRGAGTLIFNSKKELLVHLRPASKRIYPNRWACLTGGAVDYGESYLEAAQRELKEEMGIDNVPLKFLFKYSFKDDYQNMVVSVFTVTTDQKIKPSSQEIAKTKFVSLDKIRTFMKENLWVPDNQLCMERYLNEFYKK